MKDQDLVPVLRLAHVLRRPGESGGSESRLFFRFLVQEEKGEKRYTF